MKFPSVKYSIDQSLRLEQFKEMDYYAVANYDLPIELMMENAGLQLARLISSQSEPEATIKIGIGNGNNGGGGLVAARRLAAWGYKVFVDPFTEINNDLTQLQLERALHFGITLDSSAEADYWVDAYLGFSQRPPLKNTLREKIEKANQSEAIRISLDLPTGLFESVDGPYFNAHQILTLAAPKSILYKLPMTSTVYIADLGLPASVYEHFDFKMPPFHLESILQLER